MTCGGEGAAAGGVYMGWLVSRSVCRRADVVQRWASAAVRVGAWWEPQGN